MGEATFSPCGTYRYTLSRAWGDPTNRVAFCMLNPSTADASIDDPTIRRCIGFAKLWGAGALDVVNLFALRSTDPKALYKHHSPVQPRGTLINDEAIVAIAKAARFVVAAWGKHGSLLARAGHIETMLWVCRVDLVCLGVNGDGSPKHPLYLPKDAPRAPFEETLRTVTP
jgi:hypothetical protein